MKSLPNARSLVLLVGGSRGIGRETAVHLAKSGADLILTYRQDKKSAESVAEQCRSQGATVTVLDLDLGDPSDIRSFMTKLAGAGLYPQILICNGAVLTVAPMLEQTDEQIQRQFAVNAVGPLLLIKHLFSSSSGKELKRVILVGSDLARDTNAGFNVYAMTKHALLGLAEGLAQEYGNRLQMICFHPDATNTTMHKGGGRSPGFVGKLIAQVATDKYEGPIRVRGHLTEVCIWDLKPAA